MLGRLVAATAALTACARPDPYRPVPAAAALEVDNPWPAPADPPERLRVVTYNVARGANVDRLARSILDSDALRDADVWLIQEIESHPDENGSRARRLARALRLNHAYVPARAEGAGSHGLAILSRWPLSDVTRLPLPRGNLKLTPRARIAAAATIDVRGRPVRLYNVHLDTRINARQRVAQLRPVIAAARSDFADAIVIGGDFNTNPIRWAASVIPTGRSDQAGAVDASMRREGFAAATAAGGGTGVLGLRLDSVYLKNARVSAAGVASDIDASDHYPVWCDAIINTNATP